MKRIGSAVLASLVLICLVSPGCVYFNSYYMSQKYYKDAERYRDRDNGVVTRESEQLYKKAVNGAADVVRDFPETDYVDDSLFIIGMSYYRLRDFTRARTKFNEITRAFPDGEYATEAKFYKALCMIELNFYEDARSNLNELAATGDKSMKGRAGLALVDIAFRDENWEELLAASQNVIDSEPDKAELYRAIVYNARALYELERYDESTDVLGRILDDKLEPGLRWDANKLLARSKAELGKYEEALSSLTEMEGKGEFELYASWIRLETGKIYELQGDFETAEETYRDLAGTYTDSLATKEAWYRIGAIAITDLSRMDAAKEAFENVKKNRARSTELWVTESLTRSAQIDSLKAKISIIDRFEDDPENRAHARYMVAEIYTFQFERPDSAQTQYRTIIEETPESDFAVRSEYFIGLYGLQSSGDYSEDADRELMEAIVEKYPESGFSQELKVHLGLIEESPEKKAFLDAEFARMSGREPDVYLPLYGAVADSFPGTRGAAKARFAMAYYYEHEAGETDRAMELYKAISEEEVMFYNSDFVELAKQKLEYAEKEPDLLKDIEKNIVYMTYGRGKAEEEEATQTTETVEGAVEEGPSGFTKIRARNARIRSRYFTN